MILFTVLATVVLLLLSFSVYYFTALERKEVFIDRLQSLASNNAQLFTLFGENRTQLLDRIAGSTPNLLSDKTIRIYDYLGNEVYAYSDNERFDSLDITRERLEEARIKGQTVFATGRRDAIAYHYTDASNRIVVVAAAYDDDGWGRLQQLKEILLLSLLIGIVASLLVGFIFSSQLVKPISQIIHEVNDISSLNLSHRIRAGNSQDELNQLANTFNNLLTRLQDAFNIQRRFISNASHELSTPLTSISSQLEVTLQKERNAEEYQRAMLSVLEDVQQMRQLTKGLLEIARAGSEGGIELREVRIDEVLFKVTADVSRINPGYHVQLDFEDFPEEEMQCTVFGNADLLHSALKNVLENGCKYSPDHTSVVELFFKPTEVVIEIRNQGDVIAEEEIEQIFQPFYRSAAATEIKGFGLGLPLARRIIGLHKGFIGVVSDLQTGTVFTIVLPTLQSFQ